MPHFIVIGGPNGAGKSTAAPALLRDMLGLQEFVNTDTVARGLSEFRPEDAAFEAGRAVLARLRELASRRRDFAFESTLSGRSLASFIRTIQREGYRFVLVYLWLPGPDASVSRVRQRVLEGGHSVPEEVVRRRFFRGIQNFYHIYRPLAAEWRLYDSSRIGAPRLVARGQGAKELVVICAETWHNVLEVCCE